MINKTLIGRLLNKTTLCAISTSQLNSTHVDMQSFK